MKVPHLDPRFGKLVALMESTTHEGERATARRKAEVLLTPDVGGFDRAQRILAYERARAAAPNNLFAGFDEHQEIDNPGHMAREAERRAEKLKAWHARRAALIETYGSLKAVEAPCDREMLLLAAVKPWRVSQKRPHQRWTSELKGLDSLYGIDKAPAELRAAIAGAYPMPTTFREACQEFAYWQQRNEELEHAMGENGSFPGDYGLDTVAVCRMDMVRALVEHEMPLTTLPDILARYRQLRGADFWDHKTDDAIYRDLEALAAREGGQ